ncbi:unnamed protein product [Notodromas monacha]|uniref:protein-serine/threonine phosphatase n=1 Tax=Notodromas monacha TaxID=399045 RepID=A0A7R9BEA9_9CRUS|nr:unnamed protein product [Notodromas monacha]CAG0913222.1 unnamed protein product [Notodromas monacha]
MHESYQDGAVFTHSSKKASSCSKSSIPSSAPHRLIMNAPGFDFIRFRAIDLIHFRLAPFFRDTADFIDEALSSGGKVIVHCKQGISRSSTLVVAFLMLKRGMATQEALTIIRSKREVMPNEGFLQHLRDLNERLSRERN